MPVDFDFSGPESLVNTTTTGFQGNPQVVALAGGGYVIVWNDESGLGGDASGSSVRAQLYHDDGTALGGEFLVNQATDGNQSLASVTALADGGFAIAWTAFNLGYTTSDGLARVFTAGGAALGDEFSLPAAAPGQQAGPILAALGDGGFVAVWTDYGPDGSTVDGTLRGQILAADGTASSDVFEIAGYTSGSQYLPDVEVLADGRFVVSWTDYLFEPEPGRGLYGSVQARIFAADGTPQGEAFEAADRDGGQSNSTIAALEGGGFAVGWWDYSHSGAYDGRVRTFDASGTATGASFVVNVTAGAPHHGPELLAWPGGGFIAVWSDFGETNGETDAAIAARTFSESGVPTSGEQRLNALLPGRQVAPSIAVLADGSMVAAWEEYDGAAYDGSGPAVFARRFTVSAETGGAGAVFGTVGDDHLTAAPGGAILSGYAGDDRLDGGDGIDTAAYATAETGVTVRLDRAAAQDTGGAGRDRLAGIENLLGSSHADRLTGNALANQLDGGAGDDLLDGRAGDDVLRGGAGDDFYRVDAAGDAVIEQAGGGWDAVRTGADHALADEVEELFLAGAARIGTGNALANVLRGSASSNTLAGLAGDDTIRGSGGRDTIDGGDGADLIDGGVGKDTLAGGAGRDVFQFRDGDFGTTRALADVIADFSHADREKIQLNLVDADIVAGGNQAFAWIGSGAFTGVAGQLHYAQAGGSTYVEGDTSGDGLADFVIALTGTVNLVAGDFVL